jgi:hypothetical protein
MNVILAAYATHFGLRFSAQSCKLQQVREFFGLCIHNAIMHSTYFHEVQGILDVILL